MHKTEVLDGGSGNGHEPFVINGKGYNLGGHGHTKKCNSKPHVVIDQTDCYGGSGFAERYSL
ncbi:hypothetical protein [Faecalispora jeddahensis]|uniref:hypothetical protein n=1 Tax=Faecalispora jeddahensis TaxID=1414721 RepID=UPI0005A920AB|nr:hypothetical protein [Faecalispora jeddahensis]